MKGTERHLIAECRARVDDCHVTCTCGHRVEGPTPESTKEQFSAHRAAMGKKTHGGSLRSQGEPTVFRVKPRVGSRTAAEDYRTW